VDKLKKSNSVPRQILQVLYKSLIALSKNDLVQCGATASQKIRNKNNITFKALTSGIRKSYIFLLPFCFMRHFTFVCIFIEHSLLVYLLIFFVAFFVCAFSCKQQPMCNLIYLLNFDVIFSIFSDKKNRFLGKSFISLKTINKHTTSVTLLCH
jgi:hypothetical protein